MSKRRSAWKILEDTPNMDNQDVWFLKKHENGEVFGPIRFEQIRDWAMSAQIHPQDTLSNDQVVWIKSPMVTELHMDWLVELDKEVLYGPTTSGTLLEFVASGEISPETLVIHCLDGSRACIRDTEFYQTAQAAPPTEHAEPPRPPLDAQPLKGGIRANLQKRVRELEQALLERQRQLAAAREGIKRLEARVKELEAKLGVAPTRH